MTATRTIFLYIVVEYFADYVILRFSLRIASSRQARDIIAVQPCIIFLPPVVLSPTDSQRPSKLMIDDPKYSIRGGILQPLNGPRGSGFLQIQWKYLQRSYCVHANGPDF
jgi:hypothetical protein